MLPCLNAHEKRYKKGEIILHAGSMATEVGLVEEGSVNIVVDHYWGSISVFGYIKQGELFAENYAAVPGRELLVSVVAAQDCKILFINMDNLLTECKKACPFHSRIIHNLVKISAMKNIGLSRRMMHIAPKSIRENLLSYLSEQAIEQGSNHFNIPFSRQQLADYLGVDRSALSNELSKMQSDGLLTFHKNEFELLKSTS